MRPENIPPSLLRDNKMPAPIYTPENCVAAYQLDWSYSIFWRDPPTDFDWLPPLREVAEKDNIRVLQHQFAPPKISKFLLSTQPHVSPKTIAQRLKGRLQHSIRAQMPDAFRRNYGLRSIGSTRRGKLEQYLSSQLEHHPIADERVAQRFIQYQIHHAGVDLSQARSSSHSLYWYNLHIVMVNDRRWREIRHDVLLRIRDMILNASCAKGHRLSRGAILPDHIHLTLSCALEESPQHVALGYMNNIAYANGMKPLFAFNYYVGTFSEYDLGVIPRGDA
jgi:REP element-mobilizing transposase RayT